MDRQIIYITGYPRSGNTWLGRLLADILSCEYNSFDGEAGDWPGYITESPYLIRKTHALETPDAAHTVFIYRDPRDVAVSKMYYAQRPSLEDAIRAMIGQSELLGVGPYLGFMEAWWYSHRAAAEIDYRELHDTPITSLARIIGRTINIIPPEETIRRAISRQEISKAQRRYNDTHHLRHGKVGDWRNHFTKSSGRLMNEHFGQLMIDQGFEDRSDWFEALAA